MTTDLLAHDWDDYEYLDSGDGYRLERFGAWVLQRPAPVAIWPRARDAAVWERAAATYRRDTEGGGEWTFHEPVPDSWDIGWESTRFVLKTTGFGHLGIFPEQAPNWRWIADEARAFGPGFRLLNLFAYTGGTTLAAAAAGAEVCHVDAVKGVVQWASENAARSGLRDAPIRWIVDDAEKFLKREARRGSHYEGIALDPPTFGRGAQGQVFKLERDLAGLLEHCLAVLSPKARFVLLTCHTPGVVGPVLENLLKPIVRARGGRIVAGDALQVGRTAPQPLPSGVYARWLAE